MGQVHEPVMLAEVVSIMSGAPEGRLVDCTVGAGGHAEGLLDSLPGAELIGIDRDLEVLALAGARLARFGGRVRLLKGNFRDLPELLEPLGVTAVDGMLFDVGVSSLQLDRPDRGFAYGNPEAPLDMRMDPDQELTAAGLLNRLDERELARIIRDYGEERWASRIASFVVAARTRRPLTTAGDLVDVIRAAIPAAARRSGGHPARRTFQAVRIAVNDELGALQAGLEAGASLLAPEGRMVTISFHSLEDRLVKQTFRSLAGTGKYRTLTKRPLVPGPQEIARNARARSAKLRGLARLAA
ncbi:MAG: 16S rRNA (cytosine(1402)-N(4))-methyltransferase RsmH [Bacillota bacterium]|nr:16S rRNA (cytosine(1402)-N(4))-methyltransferase RsmH [Bacillota bacterium]